MKNIVLIGMSGAGKSTLGVLLAKAMGMGFIDTDILIQQKENRKLQEIIDKDGTEYFLKAEEEVLLTLQADNCVIATGGSAVYSEKGMAALLQNGEAVYLEVPFDELEKRLVNITTRGIVIKNGKTLRELFEEREPLYEKYSGIKLLCAGKTIEECVEELCTLLNE